MDVSGHDSDLTFSWFDNSWAVWTDQSRLRLRLHDRLDFDHVESWDSFGDAYDEVDFGLNGFENGICGEWWRHVNHTCIGSGRFLAFRD